jgi:hypothetical protein
VDGGGGAHCTISSSGSNTNCQSMTNRERPQHCGTCREKSQDFPKWHRDEPVALLE